MAGKTRIINRGRGHSYELDGEWCPGVTTIIKNSVPMPALTGWAARVVAEYVINRLTRRELGEDVHYLADELIEDLKRYNDTRDHPERLGGDFPRVGLTNVLKTVQYAERDAAANRGTEVHKLAERISRGEDVDVPSELEGHVDSYIAFLEAWRPTNAILEGVVLRRRRPRYMGRFDIIADFPGLGRGLVDIKTANRPPYGDTALQLAGYRFADFLLIDVVDGTIEVPMPATDWAGVLWVRADGYDLYPFTVTEDTHRLFLYGAEMARYLDEKKGAVNDARGDALEAPAQ